MARPELNHTCRRNLVHTKQHFSFVTPAGSLHTTGSFDCGTQRRIWAGSQNCVIEHKLEIFARLYTERAVTQLSAVVLHIGKGFQTCDGLYIRHDEELVLFMYALPCPSLPYLTLPYAALPIPTIPYLPLVYLPLHYSTKSLPNPTYPDPTLHTPYPSIYTPTLP